MIFFSLLLLVFALDCGHVSLHVDLISYLAAASGESL